MLCELCGIGYASRFVLEEQFEYRGLKIVLPLLAHSCNHCGCQYANVEDLSRNKQTMIAFQKDIDDELLLQL